VESPAPGFHERRPEWKAGADFSGIVEHGMIGGRSSDQQALASGVERVTLLRHAFHCRMARCGVIIWHDGTRNGG
jgi:hypothetical protein